MFAATIAYAVAHGPDPEAIFGWAVDACDDLGVLASVRHAVRDAASGPPDDYSLHQGWVLIALRNAYWQLLNAVDLERGVIDSVMRGGDTDTNAAICGGLLGAVYGVQSVPEQWAVAVLSCRPAAGDSRVRQPRPEAYWPVDALDLAKRLVAR